MRFIINGCELIEESIMTLFGVLTDFMTFFADMTRTSATHFNLHECISIHVSCIAWQTGLPPMYSNSCGVGGTIPSCHTEKQPHE